MPTSLFAARRRLLVAGAAVPFTLWLRRSDAATLDTDHAAARFAALERRYGGRLGICARDAAGGTQLGYRADERFAFCSTFKLILASAVLADSMRSPGLLDRRIRYTHGDLVAYSPISSQHVATGMTVAELCAAALQESDNSAANQLIKLVGGPAAVTAYARSIDDTAFRLDRWETSLNTAIPGDPRDTTTPAAMTRTAHALVLGDALGHSQRAQLQAWMRGNTTGDKRIRAGVPAGWRVGDKTGTGDYGTANDVAALWPPSREPLVLTVFHTHDVADAKPNDNVIAEAARIVVEAFSG
ncbi:MAG TPA: class A beta-lactamase [Paraburkholderia sp.]|jgi:beta-lactamase class A|nr:class A beta-lactamase [Paraburkholderia sp.]